MVKNIIILHLSIFNLFLVYMCKLLHVMNDFIPTPTLHDWCFT